MRRFFFQLLHGLAARYVKVEQKLLLIFAASFTLSLCVLLVVFYRANTRLVAATGGTYIEGSVGSLQPLNPWFDVQNDVNRDIVSLVFAGLLRYDPQTKSIVEDLATMTRSKDGRVYTLKLRDGLQWHDSTEAHPHPVTADDVLFTFQTVQDAKFPNSLLRQNFRGIVIKKVDDKTAQFTLDSPYSFFPSNLTLGLLPKASFEGVPLDRLDQALDFGFNPVGAGPYRLRSIVQTDLSTEITLERFERPVGPVYHLDRVIFRMFPDFPTLLSDLHSLQGLRLAPQNDKGSPVIPQNMVGSAYRLPQYVALFLNLDHPTLQDQQLRLGLQLGTNKQEIVDAIHESVIVDTPLLELNIADWRYHFDPTAAQGALFASQWYFPEKLRLQRLLEQREANNVGPLHIQAVTLLETGSVLTVTGSLVNTSTGSRINGIPIQVNTTATGTWIVALPTHGGTGAIKVGVNQIRLTDPKGRTLDTAIVWRTTNIQDYQRAATEQQLTDLFLKSKGTELPESDRITVQDLFLDSGFLRRKVVTDAIGVRVNDKGQQLTLTLLTSPSPPQYKEVADAIAREWKQLGVAVSVVVPATRAEFEERLLKRDYDALLFGQSLLDNLDSYPYWHSSGVQKQTQDSKELRLDAYNLSQYTSLDADALLETIRRTSDEKERQTSLVRLRDILKRDVPTITLYSPTYTFAHDQDILGIELGALSLHSDRFLSLDHWYVKQDRVFQDGKGWLSFVPWLWNLVANGEEGADESATGTGAAVPTGTGATLTASGAAVKH